MDECVKKTDELIKNESLLRIQIESIDQFYPDAKELFETDWLETTSGEIEFDIDESEYRLLEQQGKLLIIAARYDGKLAGYINFVDSKSMHHKASIANCSGFYVSRKYRGKTGTELLKNAIEILKKYNIHKVRVSSPAKNDIGKFLQRFGFKQEETIHSLMLG